MIEVNKELKEAVSERFTTSRGEPRYCDTFSDENKNFVHIWMSLGRGSYNRNTYILYEYYQIDCKVQLHFGGKFQHKEYRYFRDTLREETSDASKYPKLKWDEWQGNENCRCIYKKEMNSKKVSDNGFADIDLEM